MSFAPMLSLVAATRFVSLIYYSLFKEINIPVTAEQVVTITPSHTLISKIITDTAADSLAIARSKTHGSPVHLSMDAANKDNVHHMVKEAAKWDFNDDYLYTFTIDADACEGTNVKTAEGIDHSLQKFDWPDWKAIIANVTIDAGSGGVHIDLWNQLKILNRVVEDGTMHSYCLHALNLTFANSITKFFGSGGVKNINSLQLLCTCHALENEFEIET